MNEKYDWIWVLCLIVVIAVVVYESPRLTKGRLQDAPLVVSDPYEPPNSGKPTIVPRRHQERLYP